MPVTATAQGKKFTFPDGTTPEQMGQAIDEYFTGQAVNDSQQLDQQLNPPITGPSFQATDDLPTQNAQPQIESGQFFKEGFKDLSQDQQKAVVEARNAQLSAVGMPTNIQSTAVKREQNLAELKNTAPVTQQFARDLPEIGEAPELNQFSMDAVRRSLAANLINDEVELANALQGSIPNASVSLDPEGNPLLTTPSGTFAINKPGLSGQDFAKFATRFLAFLPSGRIAGATAKQLLKGAVTAGATEAGLQGAEASLGGDFDVDEAAIAGAVAPAAQAIVPAAQGVKRVFSALRGRAIQATPERELIRFGDDAGIPVFTSDVLEPRTFASRQLRETGEKIPLIGTGDWRAAQQQFRVRAVDDVAKKYGEYSYDAIINSLKAQKDSVKKAAGNVISKTAETLDDFGRISLDSTENAVSKLRTALDKPGVIKTAADDIAIDEADRLITTMKESGQIFSSLKENRTAFREVIKGIDKAERSQLTSRAKGLLQDVQSAMKTDMDKFAKKHLTPKQFQKWSRANSVYAEEAKALTRSKLKNILDKGDVTPETVNSMLFSRNPSELKLLNRSLTPDGKANARAAIIGKMFNNLAGRQGGITPNSFGTELKRHTPQIQAFFKGDERKALIGLQKVLNATRRAQDAAVTTPTGQVMFVGSLALGGATVPLETLAVAGAIGGGARLYENTVVRNALVRLAAVPKTSTRFSQALDEAVQALALATSQTANVE